MRSLPQILRGLGCRLDRRSPALFSSHNQTLRGFRGRTPVLIKVAADERAPMRVEAEVVSFLSAKQMAALEVPHLVARAPEALALEWIPGEMLFDRRLRRKEAAELDGTLGSGLAQVHASTGVPSLVQARPRPSALIDALLWTSPGVFASLSHVARQLFAAVQADARAVKALTMLRQLESEGPQVLVHGDLRHANIVIPRGKSRVLLVDWERACLGSAESDLGMLFADELALHLLPWRGQALPKHVLQTRCGALLEGYAREIKRPLPPHFVNVCAGWTGLSLLQRAITMLDERREATPEVRHVVSNALWLLQQPQAGAALLLGGRYAH